MMWHTTHCQFNVSDTVTTIWRAYRQNRFVGDMHGWSDTPVGPAEMQEHKKLEIIVEEILKEIDQKMHQAMRAETETFVSILAGAAFDDTVSLEMLERATDLLARAAVARAAKEKTGATGP